MAKQAGLKKSEWDKKASGCFPHSKRGLVILKRGFAEACRATWLSFAKQTDRREDQSCPSRLLTTEMTTMDQFSLHHHYFILTGFHYEI